MPASKVVAPTLATAAARLNKLTDEAAEKIRSVETYLNDVCSIGIPATVKTRPIADGRDEYLEYDRWGGRGFRILVTVSDGDEDGVTRKPWADCDRETKLATLVHLPNLVTALTEAVLEHTKQAEDALKAVRALDLDDIPF